jgi:hypothetical protein
MTVEVRVIRPGLLLLAALAGIVAMWPPMLSAQSPDATVADIRVGDWWTYDRKDEITGKPMGRFTSAVTEVSPAEITTRADHGPTDGAGIVVFDHDWNRIRNGKLNYKPSDGHGVRLPLIVGKEWRIEFEERNAQSGVSMKGVSLSKIAAQEMLTTPAGTFETFRIERKAQQFDAANPSKLIEMQFVLWFAPQINHWVRRTIVSKVQKHVRGSSSDELTAFGGKQ